MSLVRREIRRLGGSRPGCGKSCRLEPLLGTKTHDPDRLEFGWSSSPLQTFLAFFLSSPVSTRLSQSWTLPSISRHGFSQHIGDNASALVDTIRLLDCPWPPPCCACEVGEIILDGKRARHVITNVFSVAGCIEEMTAGWCDGRSCLIRDAPMPQCCQNRAVVATSFVLVGPKRSAL